MKFIYKTKILKKLQINCKEATRLLSEQLEHPLPWYKSALLKFHLSICDTCVYFGSQIKSLKDVIGKKNQPDEKNSSDSPAKLSEEARIRLKERLQKENLTQD